MSWSMSLKRYQDERKRNPPQIRAGQNATVGSFTSGGLANCRRSLPFCFFHID